LMQYLNRIRTNLCILLTYATIVATILELSKDLQGSLHLLDAILEITPRSTLIILYKIRNVISFSIAPWQMKVLTITQWMLVISKWSITISNKMLIKASLFTRQPPYWLILSKEFMREAIINRKIVSFKVKS
jgi:hypothetical protein